MGYWDRSRKVKTSHVSHIVLYHIGIEDAGLKPLCPPLYNILQ